MEPITYPMMSLRVLFSAPYTSHTIWITAHWVMRSSLHVHPATLICLSPIFTCTAGTPSFRTCASALMAAR
jgi:hypothetical protein